MICEDLITYAESCLSKFCLEISDRSVGSQGNQLATEFFSKELDKLSWKTDSQDFEAIDWCEEGAHLETGETSVEVFVSPYAPGCNVTAPLVSASNLEELERLNVKDQILLVHSELAKEQLMPKNFVFYNPKSHQQIIAEFERQQPAAIICATSRNAATAGGVYPFPLIEDGDFVIPSVYMTAEEGQELLTYAGQTASLLSSAQRIPSQGCNVIARKGAGDKRIVITAHIDAKKGTPGAIDNATGVVLLLLLAKILNNYKGGTRLELVALNGEDYYAASGQMRYLKENQGKFADLLFNINIDGLGYKEGPTAFSLFTLPKGTKESVLSVIEDFDDLVEGPQWVQSDHSIFIQQGCPAIAVSSSWFLEHMSDQTITHTPRDNLDIVDSVKVVEAAQALASFIGLVTEA